MLKFSSVVTNDARKTRDQALVCGPSYEKQSDSRTVARMTRRDEPVAEMVGGMDRQQPALV
jgi:hypothetical protein